MRTSETTRTGVGAIDRREFARQVEGYRGELQVHCYRLLGSLQDAEDMVQETLLRAWRGLHTFEGRAPLRAWLYRIATNVCLDALSRRPRRTLPASVAAPADPGRPPDPPLAESLWVEPYPDALLPQGDTDPETAAVRREGVALAFVAALQTLPPRQRAVLILRDVLEFRARETADLLELTVPAVTSALHRARTALARAQGAGGDRAPADAAMSEAQRVVLDRYVRAWESGNVKDLIALLKEDVTLAMPPSPSWYVGRDAVETFVASRVFEGDGSGRWRLLPTRANGGPAFGLYGLEASGEYVPFGIQTIALEGERVSEITTFILPALFRLFALPGTPPG